LAWLGEGSVSVRGRGAEREGQFYNGKINAINKKYILEYSICEEKFSNIDDSSIRNCKV
jgi:hypothetical protein